MHIGFLILHYKVTDVTFRCIESINSLILDENLLYIFVVDNCSNDGSGEFLRDIYCSYKNIEFIILSESTGFSNANNIGYKYIKDKYELDFLVVANNDIEFIQKEFINKIQYIYNKEHFFVLGPDIYIPKRNMHENPHYVEYRKKETVEKMLNSMERRIKRQIGKSIITDYIQSTKIYNFYKKNIFKHTKRYKQNLKFTSKNHREITLSGACLIFSKNFLMANEKIFWPETQFYWEEEILRHKCLLNGWHCLYNPSLKVIHDEGAATLHSYKNLVDRRMKKIQLNIDSANIYLDYIIENPLTNDKG